MLEAGGGGGIPPARQRDSGILLKKKLHVEASKNAFGRGLLTYGRGVDGEKDKNLLTW